MKLTNKLWNAFGIAEVQGSEYHTILIEVEYGYQYFIWFYQGTINEAIELFKEKRPASCLVKVSELNVDEYSLVSEVDYTTWIAAEYMANGYAHWHEPTDSNLCITDESGKHHMWRDKDAISEQYAQEDAMDEEVQDFLNDHGQRPQEDTMD